MLSLLIETHDQQGANNLTVASKGLAIRHPITRKAYLDTDALSHTEAVVIATNVPLGIPEHEANTPHAPTTG
jgi:hypothetical protein